MGEEGADMDERERSYSFPTGAQTSSGRCGDCRYWHDLADGYDQCEAAHPTHLAPDDAVIFVHGGADAALYTPSGHSSGLFAAGRNTPHD